MLLGYGEAKPVLGQLILPGQKQQLLLAGFMVGRAEYLPIIGGAQQPLTGPECSSHSNDRELGGLNRKVAYAARRLRPLARRRAITARPLLVAMRLRKPCVRLRLRTLG